MYTITLYPSCICGHVSQIYAGLFDLAAIGKIRLRLSADAARVSCARTDKMLWLEAKGSRTARKICFDMVDGHRTFQTEAIRESDVYFKRSYYTPYVEELDQPLRKKVLPFGLNYAVRSRNEIDTWRRMYLFQKINNRYRQDPLLAWMKIIGPQIKTWACNFLGVTGFGLNPLTSEFQVPAHVPAEKRVLFLTRVWESVNEPKVDSLNEFRANIVRALRDRFGPLFVGGLQRSPLAEKLYPESISPEDTSKQNYLKLLKSSLVAVTTSGLHGSIGWKLGEYVAASRCIVSEPLTSDLPEPLSEGHHLFTFRSVDECVQHCEQILCDPILATNIRNANEKYYREELEPSVLMLKRLEEAMAL